MTVSGRSGSSPRQKLSSVEKSQCALKPDSSRTFRKVCSPQRPRVLGEARCACTSFEVSARTACWVSATALSSSEAYGALSGELKAVAETQHAVRAETSELVQAQRASPKTRGGWGEHTLRDGLGLSGLG